MPKREGAHRGLNRGRSAQRPDGRIEISISLPSQFVLAGFEIGAAALLAPVDVQPPYRPPRAVQSGVAERAGPVALRPAASPSRKTAPSIN